MTKFRLHAILVGLPLLTACATLETVPGPAAPQASGAPEAGPVTAAAEPEIKYKAFPEDILNKVILAELAGQRRLDDEALRLYLELAEETQDPGIIKRAAHIAVYLQNNAAAINMLSLWIDMEPDSPEAHQTLAYQLLFQGRYRAALDHLEKLLELGHGVDFRLISSRTARDNSAVLIRDFLIEDFRNLQDKYPDNQSIQLSLAQLLQQDGRIEEAYEEVRLLSRAMEDAPEIVIVEANLLRMLDQSDKADRRLQQSLKHNPDHKQLRFVYARELVNQQRYLEAQEQFALIVEQDPLDFDMLYSLALISMEIYKYQDAKRYLQELVDHSEKLDEAHFYLAFISEQENNLTQAIEHYMQIEGGNNFLQAQRNLTNLLVEQGRYPEARQRLQSIRFSHPDFSIPLLSIEAEALMDHALFDESRQVLNMAVGAYPDNVQLLFMRSVLYDKLNDIARMEKDLRRIMTLEPDSPMAFNSLGYTLADRTTRYDEAYELIQRAIELAPDDPAIIDSLGWVQYRLGMYEEARENLRRAFSLYPDHEVAAHLGEVLWMLGDKEKANQIWQDALELKPDSEPIRNAIKRLQSSPSS